MIIQIPGSSTAHIVDIPNRNSPTGQFLKYFSHPWNFIQKGPDADSWTTETRYPIAAANLWHCWQDENVIIGIRFGAETRYAMLDIDRGSAYHPANDPAALPRIRGALEKIGIYRTVLVRSSESEGLHIYLSLAESVPTFELARSLEFALKSEKLHIAPGMLETFPNAKRYRVGEPSNFHAHRLPLQQGSFLLDRDCQPVSASIRDFLDAMDRTSKGNSITELINSFVIAKEYAHKQSFTATGEPKGERGKRWKLDCERVIETGWIAHGQTNQILGVIAQYGRIFRGLADQSLEKFVLQTAIACPGYSEFCRHQSEIEQRCRDWAHSAQKAYSPYVGDRSGNAWKEQSERKPNAHNEQQSATALERIKQAIANLGDRLFTSIREKAAALCQLAKCSISTLYKHESLWHGCNSQNQPIEADTAIDQKVIENDKESLQPVQVGLLQPNRVYEGVPTCDRPLPENKSLNPDSGESENHDLGPPGARSRVAKRPEPP